MKPYYESGGITIYHGDAREVLPTLRPIDLLLVDPPYGIEMDNNDNRGNTRRGKSLTHSKEYDDAKWDQEPIDDSLFSMARAKATWQIIFGGNFYDLPPSRCWLVWDKDNGANGYADCELAWTNLDRAVRKFRWRWHGMLQEKGGRNKEHRWHPTQKPLALMKWCISLAPNPSMILDPFMGSGTTLLATKESGCKAIGIEAQEKYAEIAAKRLSQEVFDFDGD